MEQMLASIQKAVKSVRLEMYIVHAGPTADEFRAALLGARQRGLHVRVLVDALGSAYLPDSFWRPLREAGGEFRWFNPLSLWRIFIRDHRKLLVCDEEIGFVGGFNIATEYRGDGINQGWRDLGLRVRGRLAQELAAAFDDMFDCADFKQKAYARLRKLHKQKTIPTREAELLLSGPSRNNPLKRALRQDLKRAREVWVISPYFVPPWTLRRLLVRIARQGGSVKLILPAKCDLPVVRMAARSFYRKLLAAGVQIFEYQPQILHAKLFLIDNVAYAGSANLDARSLRINYELMIRLTDRRLVGEGREIFNEMLGHSERIELAKWRSSRTFLERFKGQVARLLVARLDSFMATRQLRWWKLKWSKMKEAKKTKPSALKA